MAGSTILDQLSDPCIDATLKKLAGLSQCCNLFIYLHLHAFELLGWQELDRVMGALAIWHLGLE